jgi:hypothetical protein
LLCTAPTLARPSSRAAPPPPKQAAAHLHPTIDQYTGIRGEGIFKFFEKVGFCKNDSFFFFFFLAAPSRASGPRPFSLLWGKNQVLYAILGGTLAGAVSPPFSPPVSPFLGFLSPRLSLFRDWTAKIGSFHFSSGDSWRKGDVGYVFGTKILAASDI